MGTVIVLIHILICISLIAAVLLQTGKNSVTFTGGTSPIGFSVNSSSSFLTKLTRIIAIIFILTSLGLTIYSGKLKTGSMMDIKKMPIQNSQN